MGIAAAVVGAGALGAAASVASGAMNANAASSASKAQQNEANNSLALQAQEFAQAQKNLSPFMTAGQGALTQYGNLIGANGSGAMQTAINGLQTNPLYTSLINQGNQAILANASATGGLRSGNANYNLANFDANTLAQVYQSQIGNLGNLVNLGQNSAAGVGQFGANYANSASNIMAQSGAAQAGGILGSAGALGGGINSGISSLTGALGQYYGMSLGAPGSPGNVTGYYGMSSLPDVSLGYSTPSVI